MQDGMEKPASERTSSSWGVNLDWRGRALNRKHISVLKAKLTSQLPRDDTRKSLLYDREYTTKVYQLSSYTKLQNLTHRVSYLCGKYTMQSFHSIYEMTAPEGLHVVAAPGGAEAVGPTLLGGGPLHDSLPGQPRRGLGRRLQRLQRVARVAGPLPLRPAACVLQTQIKSTNQGRADLVGCPIDSGAVEESPHAHLCESARCLVVMLGTTSCQDATLIDTQLRPLAEMKLVESLSEHIHNNALL